LVRSGLKWEQQGHNSFNLAAKAAIGIPPRHLRFPRSDEKMK